MDETKCRPRYGLAYWFRRLIERPVTMPNQPTTIVANSLQLARRIGCELSDRYGCKIIECTYENCRSLISWHRSGALILVAQTDDDFEPFQRLVREHHLRKSSQSIVVLETGSQNVSAQWPYVRPFVRAWHRWPEDAQELVGIVGIGSTGDAYSGSMADNIASHLMSVAPSLAPIAGQFALAAVHDVSVLLTGETGTGKTYMAKLLHSLSPRRDQPFLMVPCGAQPAELFESALFGHVKGAFTGAIQSRQGKFAAAGKGTILLDEIDTLGLEQQAALLRVIETGEYEMVGGHETLKSEARLIVASNCDLEEAVDCGQFRQDLYYRLNVLAFHLPPLRERRNDIGQLARHFAAQFAEKFDSPIVDISAEAVSVLQTFSWPGNIRQLENVIQQATLLCQGSELTVGDLPMELQTHAIVPHVVVSTNDQGHQNGAGRLVRDRTEFERVQIQQALDSCQQNRSAAARVLGISRVTLHKKIKQFGLARTAEMRGWKTARA